MLKFRKFHALHTPLETLVVDRPDSVTTNVDKKARLPTCVALIQTSKRQLVSLVLAFLLGLPIALRLMSGDGLQSSFFGAPDTGQSSAIGRLERTGTIGSVPGLFIGKTALTPVPSENSNRYFVYGTPAVESGFRTAFDGWEKDRSNQYSFLMWMHCPQIENHSNARPQQIVHKDLLRPWQRINRLPREGILGKDKLPGELVRYKEDTGRSLPFLPATFRLHVETEKNEFLEYVEDGGGMDVPWVLKDVYVHGGKGVSMIGPRSDALRRLKQRLKSVDFTTEEQIVEKYICNEFTYEGRKFDLRVYVVVASVDPLVVFYHDGFLRINPGLHDETNFESTSAHLTNISQNQKKSSDRNAQSSKAKAISGSFSRLQEQMLDHVASSPSLRHISDPLGYIRSQMKGALAIAIEAVRHTLADLKDLPTENLYTVLGADFILDKDLNVWFIEANSCPGQGKIEHDREQWYRMVPEVLSVVKEVFDKQTKGEAIFPLKNINGLELIYTDEEVYRHDFGSRGESKCQ